MSLAGLVGGLGHAAVEQLPSITDDVIPLEGRAGVGFVGLDVEVAEDAFVFVQLVIGQLLRNDFAFGVVRIVALDLGKYFAKRRCQFDQGCVLLGGEIVLPELVALNRAGDRFRARRVADKAFGADAAVAQALGNGDACLAVGVPGVPFVERALAP